MPGRREDWDYWRDRRYRYDRKDGFNGRPMDNTRSNLNRTHLWRKWDSEIIYDHFGQAIGSRSRAYGREPPGIRNESREISYRERAYERTIREEMAQTARSSASLVMEKQRAGENMPQERSNGAVSSSNIASQSPSPGHCCKTRNLKEGNVGTKKAVPNSVASTANITPTASSRSILTLLDTIVLTSEISGRIIPRDKIYMASGRNMFKEMPSTILSFRIACCNISHEKIDVFLKQHISKEISYHFQITEKGAKNGVGGLIKFKSLEDSINSLKKLAFKCICGYFCEFGFFK